MNTKTIFFMSLLLALIPRVVTAETMYINDNLEVTVRGGKGTEYKILAIKQAHEPVDVLKTEGEYSYVRLDSGVEGWILRRYLTGELPGPMVIVNLKSEMEQVKAQHASMSQEYQKLKEQKQSLERAAALCAEQAKNLGQQYQDLKSASADVIKLKEQHARLQEENRKSRLSITYLTEQNLRLQNYQSLMWFIAGGATLLTGIVIGLVIQRLRGRTKRSIHF